MFKLVVTDLDNTLLEKNGELADSTINICRKITEQNIILAIATGRSFPSAKAISEKIGIDTPVICYNGAQIRNVDGSYIFSSSVPENVRKGIVSFVKEKKLYLQAYDNDEIVTAKLNLKIHPDPDIKYAKYRETGDIDMLAQIDTPKFLIATTSNETEEIENELREKYKNKAYFAKSEAYLIEVMKNGINKGVAVDYLAAKYNIKKNEILAIGDNTNDKLLLNHAGFKIAVGNAVESIKSIADYVSKGERGEGFNEAITKYLFRN